MVYEYTGHLATLMGVSMPPAPPEAPSVVFDAGDISRWITKDLQSLHKDWRGISLTRSRKENILALQGHFREIRRMDCLPANAACYWAPLGTLGWEDERLPIDLSLYPVMEVTYRNLSENGSVAILWLYEGGMSVLRLPQSAGWRTAASLLSLDGFPAKATGIVIRLYSPTRTKELLEIEGISFRALTPEESAAMKSGMTELRVTHKPPRYPVLDKFIPLGVSMDAATARRQAEMLGISFQEYWGLAFEDIVTHHHNSISLSGLAQLSPTEWTNMVNSAESFGIKIVANFDLRSVADPEEWDEYLEETILPCADSDTILAWGVQGDFAEGDLTSLLVARTRLLEYDKKHPLTVTASFTTGLPHACAAFSAVGFRCPVSHTPWDLSKTVREHASRMRGQQLWFEAPAFVYATGTPEWSTCPEMRLMANLTFANGVKGWFSHSYHNDPIWSGGAFERSLTGPFLTFSDIWSELNNCLEPFNALAPMLLKSEPARLPHGWFLSSNVSEERCQLPPGVALCDTFRLRGPDFSLFAGVSNETRGIVSLNMDIPGRILRGQEMHDLTDYVRLRRWQPMTLSRHIEMFPGEVRILLVGPPEICAYWRDAIAARLIEEDRRQMAFHLHLAGMYNLDTSGVRRLIESIGSGGDFARLEIMDQALGMLQDTLYSAPAIAEARSGIIDACAAVSACDGNLCRLASEGRADQAHELGLQVIPLAREFTNLRLALRAGRGAETAGHARDLASRALQLLELIRTRVRPLTALHRNAQT